MTKINPRFNIIFLALLGLMILSTSKAQAFNGVTGNVFKFQQKLAESGNMQSQYKLGRMYETGRGTEKNMDEAMRWYHEASKNGFVPANDRITYFEVKQVGYSSDKYGSWVDAVIDKAKQRVPESMVLLAQMHAEGIGVKKDDNRALELLHSLSMDGNSEVDADIAVIDSRIARTRQQQKAAARRAAAKKAEAKASKVVLKTPAESVASAASVDVGVSQPKTAGTGSIADKVEAELVAKKRRFEAVMKQLQEEQKLLEEQQAWAEN